MPRLSRDDALEDISGWATADVVTLLRKNGVDEACWRTVEKRQIDGDELLHLTEGKLALWKSDLTKPLIWSLWTFVEELKKCPEKYVKEREMEQQQQQLQEQQMSPNGQYRADEQLSDTGSWDTDFEDGLDNEFYEGVNNQADAVPAETGVGSNFHNSLRLFQENDRLKMQSGTSSSNSTRKSSEIKAITPDAASTESTYSNCDGSAERSPECSENTYANVGYEESNLQASLEQKLSTRHLSKEQITLAEKLMEHLILMGAASPRMTSSRPAIVPKPEALGKRGKGVPRESFLHKPKLNGAQKNSKAPSSSGSSPLGSEKKTSTCSSCSTSSAEEVLRNLPKPPVSVCGFDLVANLPTSRTADDSEDEHPDGRENYDAPYEPFNEQIVEQRLRRPRSIVRGDSGQSLSSVGQSSVESVYRPPSSVSHEEEEEPYEIYESITESPEENGRDYRRESNTKNLINPPPLPAKPPPTITSLQNYVSKAEAKTERSLEKRSATLPNSGSNTSLANAARPLPPPPDKQSYYDRPWFHNLTRDQANVIIAGQGTYSISPDGYFLMRPSVSNPNNPLTLVLWCKDRVYNVPVRRRPDNRYALGSAKTDEQSFASIDEIIPFYKQEKLLLYTGGVQTGSTRLSETPPK